MIIYSHNRGCKRTSPSAFAKAHSGTGYVLDTYTDPLAL